MSETPQKKSLLLRLLDFIEWGGNKLPHPATLFALLAAAVVAGSALLAAIDFVAVHPSTGKEIRAVSLLNGDGLRRIITTLVTNFTGFAPLGTVLVALLGVGVAEGSGLLSAALRALVLSAPRRLITVVVVFAGVMSNAASEAGYVILIPLAGVEPGRPGAGIRSPILPAPALDRSGLGEQCTRVPVREF